MIQVKETAGDSLVGAINGVNQAFLTSFDFNTANVKVYLNGVLLQADLETGYDLIPPRTIVMKEPPLSDPDGADTLEVEYRADVKTGGGALGGCPSAPLAGRVEPTVSTHEDRPGVLAGNLAPTAFTEDDRPAMLGIGGLKPSMLGKEEKC